MDLHQYYFSTSGNLIGVIPCTFMIAVVKGPFYGFDKKTRIITCETGRYHLPENKAEPSKTPNLFGRTKDILNKLSVQVCNKQPLYEISIMALHNKTDFE